MPVPCLRGIARRARLGKVIGLGRRAAGDHPHAAQHGLLRPEAEAALRLVLVVEALGQIEQPGLVERDTLGHGHAHVEVLARVTHLRVAASRSISAAARPVGSSSLSTSCSSSVMRSRTRPRSTCESGVT